MLPGGASSKEPTCQCRRHEGGFGPYVRKTPWRRAQQPTLVFLPGKSLREAWKATVHRVAKSLKQLGRHVPCYLEGISNFFSNCFENPPSIFIFKSLMIMSWWRALRGESIWECLSLCTQIAIPSPDLVSLQLLFFRVSFFSLSLSSTSSETPITQLLLHLMVFHYSHRPSSVFFFLISFFSFACLISWYLSTSSQILSSAWLSLILKFSTAFFSVFFRSRICFVLFMISFSSLKFSFCSCIVFLNSLNC